MKTFSHSLPQSFVYIDIWFWIFCFTQIHQIFCSTKITDVDGKEYNWPLPTAKFEFNYPNAIGFRYEAEEVRKAIRAGKKEHESVPLANSLAIARVQDELRRQLGVYYEGHDD